MNTNNIIHRNKWQRVWFVIKQKCLSITDYIRATTPARQVALSGVTPCGVITPCGVMLIRLPLIEQVNLGRMVSLL